MNCFVISSFCFCVFVRASLFVFGLVVLFSVYSSSLLFSCHYQCNQLPGKTRLRNDLSCVEWDVKLYTHSQSC